MKTKRVQVSKNPKFRRCLAQAIIAEAHPGYLISLQGKHYADPVAGIVYLRKDDQPWDDDVAFRVVPVDNLVSGTSDYSDEVDWEIPEIPYADMLSAFLVDEDETWEPQRSEVIQFARRHQWKERIEEIEDLAHDETIDLILDEILDEVDVRS